MKTYKVTSQVVITKVGHVKASTNSEAHTKWANGEFLGAITQTVGGEHVTGVVEQDLPIRVAPATPTHLLELALSAAAEVMTEHDGDRDEYQRATHRYAILAVLEAIMDIDGCSASDALSRTIAKMREGQS